MEKIKFVRIKTEHAVLIIPFKEYLKGLDNENIGIPYNFVEEKELKKLNWRVLDRGVI